METWFSNLAKGIKNVSVTGKLRPSDTVLPQ
jgi:hypothetical protein